MDVTLVTYFKYPDLAPDDMLFRDALRRHGATVRTAVWTDTGVDWSLSPVTVVRSTWDYPQRFAEFQAWLARVERVTRLVNDPHVIRWNVHKRYLGQLEERGVTIAPTAFVDGGSEPDLPHVCAERGWDDVVVKPCVSGSSFGAARFTGPMIASGGERHLRELCRTGDAMVQPYLPEVGSAGERAYIFVEGTFTHAVRKLPFNSSTETTSECPHEPQAAELAFAAHALEASGESPAYARVDVVPAAAGPLLMELELIEPTLYFEFSPECANRLAAAVLAK